MSFSNQHFEKLVESGKPVGEVIGVDKFSCKSVACSPPPFMLSLCSKTGSKYL